MAPKKKSGRKSTPAPETARASSGDGQLTPGAKLVVGVGAVMILLVLGSQVMSGPSIGSRGRDGSEREPIHADDDDGTSLEAPSDVGSVPSSAERTASGLASRVLRPGTGHEHPTAASTVRVHYTGWQTNGTMFDSSRAHGGDPVEFPLRNVIPGWTEGLQLMVAGERRRFWIPAELAYGTDPPPGAPAGMLVFDVELLAIL